MQVWFSTQNSINIIYQINRVKKKNHIPYQLNVEEMMDKIQHPFGEKLSKLEPEEDFNPIKGS